jgi:TetR/AcrR family transcriptional regulator, repressor for uid operon
MPKLKPDTQRLRREHILDAAERCFARAGFHATTMQDICKEAVVSPGALYVYFTSKEALIEGICERDRSEFQARFADLADAEDFFEALRAIGEQYFVEEPSHKRLMCLEIGLESTRNPRVGGIFRSVDDYVCDSFQDLFQRLKDDGRIAPALDIPTLAKAFCLIGDGLFWRRAVDIFDGEVMVPAMVALVRELLKPVEGAPRAAEPQRIALKKIAKVTS